MRAVPAPQQNQAPQATDRREKYKPDNTFLGARKDKTVFTVNNQFITDEDDFFLCQYLTSGRGEGTVGRFHVKCPRKYGIDPELIFLAQISNVIVFETV